MHGDAQKAPNPNGCGIHETPGVQHEGVAKIRPVAQHGSRNLRPRFAPEIERLEKMTESSVLWVSNRSSR